jgi:hypothetical protein
MSHFKFTGKVVAALAGAILTVLAAFNLLTTDQALAVTAAVGTILAALQPTRTDKE